MSTPVTVKATQTITNRPPNSFERWENRTPESFWVNRPVWVWDRMCWKKGHILKIEDGQATVGLSSGGFNLHADITTDNIWPFVE